MGIMFGYWIYKLLAYVGDELQDVRENLDDWLRAYPGLWLAA